MGRNRILTKILGLHEGDRIRVRWVSRKGRVYYRYGYVLKVKTSFSKILVVLDNGIHYFLPKSEVELSYEEKKVERKERFL